MERKLRKSYLLMFPFFIITLIVIIGIGTWISARLIRPMMAASQHTADQIIAKGLDQEVIQDIVADGGGIMYLHQDGEVEQVCGIRVLDANHLSMQELTDFLVNAKEPYASYKNSIVYDEEKEAWLVVSFPLSMRIQIIFAANRESKEYGISLFFYISLALCMVLTLFVLAWCYARHSAKTYSKPLIQVCNHVRQIATGNYEVKEQKSAIEEYEWLQEDVKKLASQLKEEKNMTKQLEDSKRQMLLDISHDLRNPLATILGYSESLCQEDGLSQKERENYTEVIYRNSMRAHALMNDLFEYTKLEQPTFKVEMKPVDLCEFLREFVASYVPDIESAGFESEFDIPEEEWYVMLDEKQMERALGNLVSNSLRYNPSGTKLSLKLSVNESIVIIHICDNGIGIEESLCESIFLPFTRVDKARNSKAGGSGLGLSISRKIMEALGGTIRLESKENRGCDFMICLPLMERVVK